MLARASTKTFVSRVRKTAKKNLRLPKNSSAGSLVSRGITVYYGATVVYGVRRWPKRRHAAHTCTQWVFLFVCVRVTHSVCHSPHIPFRLLWYKNMGAPGKLVDTSTHVARQSTTCEVLAAILLKFPLFSEVTLCGKHWSTKFQSQCGIRNQLDITQYYVYFSFISCTTCFGLPCAHPQELTP